MFWRFGGYANISTIDTILDKPEFTLEELLDEGDLIQELKQHNSKLLDYLRQRDVLAKLLEYVVVPKLEPVASSDDEENEEEADAKGKGRALPFGRGRASSGATEPDNEEEEAEKKRNKYAYVSCEILSSDNWSICEVLMEAGSRDLLFKFWEFLKRPTPLDPLQASYFTKVNESLFDKKTEEMIEFLKKVDNAVPDMLRHVDCPMIMDLLLKIISLERTDSGNGIVEWLYGQDLMPSLLAFLDPKHSWATQTSAGDFLKAIITVSANASQNEQTCIGPNELTRQLVSRPCVSKLIGYMLGGGNALTVGVGIVIEVIRKNNSDYDPDVGADPTAVPSSRDPIYLGTLLRMFADNVPNFITLVQNAPAQKSRLQSTFGDKIEPLGFDRFKTCELMAELLHCSNMGLLNEVGAEQLIATRDVDRQRLREEGKLTSARVDDLPAAEDITMRTGTEPEEVRRLEVTNATDDDGFEEVTHSGEVGEDTSHEFVKAEDELPKNSPGLFLGKDDEEDDFVEEPLSSPRLKVHDVPPADTQFENPELVVAPLSPSKKKPASSSPEKGASPSEGTREKIEDLSLDEKKQVDATEVSSLEQEPEAVSAEKEPADDLESPIMFAPTVPSMEKPEDLKIDTPADAASPAAHTAPLVKELSPHPEDTPAPLFSKPTSPTKPVEEKPTSGSPVEKPALSAVKANEDVEMKDAEKPTDDEAAPVADDLPEVSEPPVEAPDLPPVVGDYLKRQFVEHKVVPTILSFFFSYPWNNFLHNVVYDIVQQVFNGPMDRGYNPILAISLFEAADVTNRIIKGQQASEESQSQNKTRMGYMGHLTLIAEEVVKFTERHPPELLSETVLEKVMAPDWVNYVEGALAETRERDNAILGGVRPEVAMSNRAAASGLAGVGLSGLGSALGLGNQGSSALADAGLNGGLEQGSGEGGVGPFSISAGISSGFHSSSDEDGDDVEDNDEDVNQEVSSFFAKFQRGPLLRPRPFPGIPRSDTGQLPRSVSGQFRVETILEEDEDDWIDEVMEPGQVYEDDDILDQMEDDVELPILRRSPLKIDRPYSGSRTFPGIPRSDTGQLPVNLARPNTGSQLLPGGIRHSDTGQLKTKMNSLDIGSRPFPGIRRSDTGQLPDLADRSDTGSGLSPNIRRSDTGQLPDNLDRPDHGSRLFSGIRRSDTGQLPDLTDRSDISSRFSNLRRSDTGRLSDDFDRPDHGSRLFSNLRRSDTGQLPDNADRPGTGSRPFPGIPRSDTIQLPVIRAETEPTSPLAEALDRAEAEHAKTASEDIQVTKSRPLPTPKERRAASADWLSGGRSLPFRSPGARRC